MILLEQFQRIISLGIAKFVLKKGENDNDKTNDDIIRVNVINWMRSLDDEICWTTVVEKFPLL